MPNDLIKLEDGDGEHGGSAPISPLVRGTQRTQNAKKAEAEARQARRHGETVFAYLRREDARAQMQRRWDWGDVPTWTILFSLTAIGLIIAIAAYFLPWGQHMAPPTIKVY